MMTQIPSNLINMKEAHNKNLLLINLMKSMLGTVTNILIIAQGALV